MRTAPWGTLVVGFVGLFAFFTFALAMAFGSPTLPITAYLQLMHFGALVLSFSGAVHWGLAIGANAPAALRSLHGGISLVRFLWHSDG